MGKAEKKRGCVRYHGVRWIQADLPTECQDWLEDLYHSNSTRKEVAKLLSCDRWKWPKRTHYFFSDMHADADAFIASLVASGGIKKTGPRDHDFKLSKMGRKAIFVIGGDCFDKGPSSVRLLRVIRLLMARKARVVMLAGNHDVRILLGIRALNLPSNPRTDHFFVRMSPKVIPLLKEIYHHYLEGDKALKGVPDTRECRRRLYPSKKWFKEFPPLASWVMPDAGIEREMKRLRTKLDKFEERCNRGGLTLRMVYAAAVKWQQLFLRPDGEYYWFYDKMQLAYRKGSFLFIHAGLDDRTARIISEHGVGQLNREFRRQIRGDLFDFYYGPLANAIRTKYRDVDMPLTRYGTAAVRTKGIYSIVHGHQRLLRGQTITLRKGIINFQCDATIDRNTRKREGLPGLGAAATLVLPSKTILGISTDSPKVKAFDYRAYAGQAGKES